MFLARLKDMDLCKCYEWIIRIGKILVAVIIIMGITLNSIDNKKRIRTNELQKKIDKYIYDEGWGSNEDGKYLNFAVRVKYTRFIFDERDIFKIVQKNLNYHNDRVDKRENDRRYGYSVKPKDEIYDLKLRAVLMKDYEINGDVDDWIVFMSENVDSEATRKIENRGIIIPLEYFEKKN